MRLRRRYPLRMFGRADLLEAIFLGRAGGLFGHWKLPSTYLGDEKTVREAAGGVSFSPRSNSARVTNLPIILKMLIG